MYKLIVLWFDVAYTQLITFNIIQYVTQGCDENKPFSL